MSQAAIELPGARPRRRARLPWVGLRRIAIVVLLGLLVALAISEGRSSHTQARAFHALANAMRFDSISANALPAVSSAPPADRLGGELDALPVDLPPQPAVWQEWEAWGPLAGELARSPHSGPYDTRLGHDRVPELASRALERGFRVETRTRHSRALGVAQQLGIGAPYREKAQAGLRIRGREGLPLYVSQWPERVYESFEQIPEPVVAALIFAENRELLEPSLPSKNPVLEWDRLALAALAYPLNRVDASSHPFGGSTLATQIQKFRHSEGGRTNGLADKLRQIVSASLLIYRTGEDTTAARRDVVLDYLNGVPLAAFPGYGEVLGVPDGLRVWMNADFARTNALLRDDDPDDEQEIAARGLAFRRMLALILAAQRPSYFLRQSPQDLDQRTDTYLALMSEQGVVSKELADAALAAGPVLSTAHQPAPSGPTDAQRKAATPVRGVLVPLLGTAGHYELDRLDLTVDSTLDTRAQGEANRLLQSLGDPEKLRELGLLGPRQLASGDPGRVRYSLALYERGEGANLLRVSTDNLHGPFDLNDGARMDLGSTAKLRTLISYLEAVTDVYRAHAGRPAAALRALAIDPSDAIATFVVARLAQQPDLALETLLVESLDRRYSASPYETFYTGGGQHRFQNFDKDDNGRIMTVREAFRRSVNLVFVRIMRDVVRHRIAAQIGDPTKLLADRADPRRRAYLESFAEHESRLYLERFVRRHRGKTTDASIDLMLPKARRTPTRLATLLLYLDPVLEPAGLATAMAMHDVRADLEEIERLHAKYGPERFGISDRAYIAHVHSLELWLVGHLSAHPDMPFAEILEASAEARAESTAWLFRTSRKHVADRAIRTMLEREAFAAIHSDWRRVGYPFGDLVPSYATAIGSSGDRPAALAELMGILLAGGVRQPNVRIERLRFAEDTPWEAIVAADPAPGERVLAPEIARVAHSALLETVEMGTARRAHGTIHGRDGAALAIGGKTGTGDHRLESFDRSGAILTSEARARTATFAFTLGERFFGVLTASVAGPEADEYAFTSSLPVELVRVLAPILERTIADSDPYELHASR